MRAATAREERRTFVDGTLVTVEVWVGDRWLPVEGQREHSYTKFSRGFVTFEVTVLLDYEAEGQQALRDAIQRNERVEVRQVVPAGASKDGQTHIDRASVLVAGLGWRFPDNGLAEETYKMAGHLVDDPEAGTHQGS